MYKLDKIYLDFFNIITNIKKIIDKLSIYQKNFERDIYIEGCFLKFVVYLENFFEEYFLSCMCGAITKSKRKLKPKGCIYHNKQDAFKRISENNWSREKNYLDWLDHSTIKIRITNYFHKNSRVHFIYEKPEFMNNIKIIRNYIAHNSKKSKEKFKDMVIQNCGYLPSPNTNVTDFLLSINRNILDKYYSIYIKYYSDLVKRLIK